MKLYYFDARYQHSWSVWTRHWHVTQARADEARQNFIAENLHGEEDEDGEVCTEVYTVEVPAELAPHVTALRNFIACHGDPNGE